MRSELRLRSAIRSMIRRMNMLHDSLSLFESTNLAVPAHTNDLEVASLVPQTPASLTGGRHA